MGSKQDDWLKNLGTHGAEFGWGDDSIGISDGPAGTTVTLKHEEKVNLFRQNFKVWVIPCYTKGDLKASIEGSLTKGDDSTSVSAAVKAGGSVELGIGGTSEAVTGGPYLEAALTASDTVTLAWDDKGEVTFEPMNIAIFASGKIGIKLEINKGPTFNEDMQIVNWELFIVVCGRYQKGKFTSVVCKPGKDMQRLIAWGQTIGPKVSAFVDEYAPEAVKKVAEDTAKWAAESPDAKKIADQTQKAVDYVSKKTGVDVGAGVENIVRTLCDPSGETSEEATARVEQQLKAFNDCADDLHEVMTACGLKEELRPYRSSEEYNAIVDVWIAESESAIRGGAAPGAWKSMAAELAVKARERKAAKEAEAAARKKFEQDAASAELLARAKNAVAQMEAAATAATGQGNVLNNRTKDAPDAHPKARKYLVDGQKDYFAAQAAKPKVLAMDPQGQVDNAPQVTQLYLKAADTFTTGIHHI